MDQRPIGFLDSGLGGLSVLSEALRQLPDENYIYFGDTLNAPYGDKDPEEVSRLTHLAVDKLIAMDCKAIVIACNTATSCAAGQLRRELNLPIIGLEPALKPASLLPGEGKILVIRPQHPMEVGRLESDPGKLTALYNEGYEEAGRMLSGLSMR